MKNEDITTINCPIAYCKGRLVYSTNKSTGKRFIGCKEYPKCIYTEPVEKEDELDDIASI